MKILSIVYTFIALLFFVKGAAQGQTMESFESALHTKILTLYEQGKYEEAMTYARIRAQKAEKKFGTEDSTYAFAMTWVGVIAVDLELFEEAEKSYRAAMNARAKVYGTNHRSYAGSITNLAGLYLALGQYEKAEPLYQQGRKIFAEVLGVEHPNYATTTGNLAYLYALSGRYELAEKLYNETIAIRGKIQGKRHYLYAVALNNLSLLYHDLKEYDKEAKLLEEVLDITSEALGRDHPYYADYLNNLAGLYVETKRYVEAEALYKQSLDLYRETVGSNHSNYARSLNNLSALYLTARRYDEAFPLEEQACKIWEQKLGKKHPQLARAYCNMALLSLHRNDKKTAQYYINAAFSANSDKLLQASDMKTLFDSLQHCVFMSVPSAIQMCEQLVQMQDIIRRKSEGNTGNEAYLDVVERSLLLTTQLSQSFMLEEDRLQLLNFSMPLLSAHIHASLEAGDSPIHIENAFWSADQNKSYLLASALNAKQQVNFGGLPDSLAKKEASMKQNLDLLHKKLFESLDDNYKKDIQIQIANLNLDIEAFKNELQKKYPKYYEFRFETERHKISDLQALLPEKALLLEYFLEDTLLYTFALSKQDLKVFRHPIKDAVLSKHCKDYRALVSHYDDRSDDVGEKLEAYTDVAYQLYQELLEAPLKAHPSCDFLIVVADGELGHIPFEAFLTKKVSNSKGYGDLPYLLHDYKVSYSYSAKLWMENYKQATLKDRQTILAMAATYKTDSAQGDKVATSRSGALRNLRDALKDLPAAKKEVETLSKHFKGDFLTGVSANEAAFKSKSNEHGIVHLAMHGLIDIKNPILSSIAFSENGDTLEDNFLQAFEVSGLDLHAQLVVLSACETGYGRFKQGEGVMSLARSFMYAGVPSLVVSLWQVNDESTAMIMQSFYKNLAKGLDKATALQRAKLEYMRAVSADGSPLQQSAHPAFWAPFVQLGDSRPIKIETKTQLSNWIWVGLGLLLVAGATIFLRKKNG